MSATVKPFFDQATYTWTYVVADPATRHCVVIDPVLDFEPASAKISSDSADLIIDYIKAHDLVVDYLLETHVHADHLSASHYMRDKIGSEIGIGSDVTQVQSTFGGLFNTGEQFATDGSQFDHLFKDGDTFEVGKLTFRVMHTPGHTPACVTYVLDEQAAFVGDSLFMPDYGTARSDFPGGDAGALFDSIQKILSLPAETVLYMCHDYLPEGRTEYSCKTTVAKEQNNIHLKDKDKGEFIAARQARDKELAAPRLLLPSIQINMRAGELPPAEGNDVHYLKLPIKVATR